MTGALGPEGILARLQDLDPELRRKRYHGELVLFYNPADRAPLGVIIASIKDHDGPNDRRAELSRTGVYRLAFDSLRPLVAESLEAARHRRLSPRARASRRTPAPSRR